MLVAEKNRLNRAGQAVRPRIRAHIEWLEQELKDLDRGCGICCAAARCGGSRTICCAPFLE